MSIAAGIGAALLTVVVPNLADVDVKPAPGMFTGEAADHAQHTKQPHAAADSTASPSSVVWGSEPCTDHQSACSGLTCPPGQQAVVVYAASGANSVHPACHGGAQVVTAAAVAHAFRRIRVPTPALHIQPVKGRTLVNFKTNFYATGGAEFTRTVTLLGQRVTLRIHVDHYDFAFGDGQHLTTTAAGAAYPDFTDHHVYLRKGVVHPGLTTTWAADYRINGGGWQNVTGTVTVHGPTQRLEVTTARPVLVNPASAG